MDLEPLLHKISSDAEGGGLVHLSRLGTRPSRTVRPDPALPPALSRRLSSLGINGLWTHQAEAIAAVRRGDHTIVASGTASGKSLCFNLPVFEKILTDRQARALYLYPTKALAQDQLRAIRAFALPRISAATYDGDTPSEERSSVRRYASIVLSNPDMLHFGILPQHSRWADFFAHLSFVVVDEVHILRGIFGSHVGAILRRLRRVAGHYGADPVFILASATIGNPRELAESLVGVSFTEIAHDASPRGEQIFAFWNPPLLDDARGVRGSANWESARLLASLVEHQIRTIAFAKSRKSAELIARYAKEMVSSHEIAGRIRPYRAGYLASERREIEGLLFSGELLGVSATTALELGVDVGGLDAVVMNGFPGTVAAVWQQAGRAGRSGEESAAVLVGHEDPLDQYYINHPEFLLSKAYEAALVDVTNPNILRPHLGSSAFELPLEVDRAEAVFGQGAAEVARAMVDDGELALRTRRATRRSASIGGEKVLHWKMRQPPGRDLDIRASGGYAFAIVESETGALLGTVDGARAFHQVHPGAIYLHQGEDFEVSALDIENQIALVGPSTGDFFTQSRATSDIRILSVSSDKLVGQARFFVGRVVVTEKVVAYVRRSVATGEIVALVDLNLPEQVLDTVAFWYTVQDDLIVHARIEKADLPGALHAAEHAAIGILPLFAMADRWDIGGVSTALSADTGMPTVFIYDGYPGGAGIAERGFAQAGEHLGATLEAVQSCPCASGCPSCVQSPKCGNGNEPLDKVAAIRLMREILVDA